jgi:hypothetical protein
LRWIFVVSSPPERCEFLRQRAVRHPQVERAGRVSASAIAWSTSATTNHSSSSPPNWLLLMTLLAKGKRWPSEGDACRYCGRKSTLACNTTGLKDPTWLRSAWTPQRLNAFTELTWTWWVASSPDAYPTRTPSPTSPLTFPGGNGNRLDTHACDSPQASHAGTARSRVRPSRIITSRWAQAATLGSRATRTTARLP